MYITPLPPASAHMLFRHCQPFDEVPPYPLRSRVVGIRLRLTLYVRAYVRRRRSLDQGWVGVLGVTYLGMYRYIYVFWNFR